MDRRTFVHDFATQPKQSQPFGVAGRQLLMHVDVGVQVLHRPVPLVGCPVVRQLVAM